MQHIVYITPDFDFIEQTFTEMEREASKDPKAFLKKAKKDSEMKVYDKVSSFANDFNDEKISDQGFIIIVNDNLTQKDLDLESIRRAVRERGIEDPAAPGVIILDMVPCDFYDGMDNEDPFAVIEKKLGYDGIDIPAMNDDGYLYNSYLMQIRLVKLKSGEDELHFVTKNAVEEFILPADVLYTETVARIRELLLDTFGEKEYAWLALYNGVTRHGASEGIRRAAKQLGKQIKPSTLFEGKLKSGAKVDDLAAKNIREALCDSSRQSDEVIDIYLKQQNIIPYPEI